MITDKQLQIAHRIAEALEEGIDFDEVYENIQREQEYMEQKKQNQIPTTEQRQRKYFMRRGTVTHGCYVGGEWSERNYHIEAQAETEEDLEEEVKRLTKEHSSSGSRIDFGFVSNTKTVNWEKDTFSLQKV